MNKIQNLTREEATKAGFAGFNGGQHVCLDYNEEKGDQRQLTVTIKLPHRNESLTVCIMENGDGELECADIQFHSHLERYVPVTAMKKEEDRELYARRAIMFGPGYSDNRMVPAGTPGGLAHYLYGTLLSLMLHPRHYNQPLKS